MTNTGEYKVKLQDTLKAISLFLCDRFNLIISIYNLNCDPILKYSPKCKQLIDNDSNTDHSESN